MSVKNLVLLTLPLGNLADLTTRVRQALEDGHNFVVEDTRHMIALLRHLGIDTKSKKLIAFHDHSDEKKLRSILGEGPETLYLASDAGSPMISDPGHPLVQEALRLGIHVTSYPGASAFTVALEISGLAPLPLHFFGFFPRENSKRKEMIAQLKKLYGTCAFYESPYRVFEALSLLCQEFPESKFCLARELTKKFESTYNFFGHEFEGAKEEIRAQGECVILVEILKRDGKNNEYPEKLKELAESIIEQGARPKLLAKLISEITGGDSKEIYKKFI